MLLLLWCLSWSLVWSWRRGRKPCWWIWPTSWNISLSLSLFLFLSLFSVFFIKSWMKSSFSVCFHTWKHCQINFRTLNMKDAVDTVTGFLAIPPYVTMVPPCLKPWICYYNEEKHSRRKKKVEFIRTQHFLSYLKNLRTKEAAFPPTQLNPKAGSGILS